VQVTVFGYVHAEGEKLRDRHDLQVRDLAADPLVHACITPRVQSLCTPKTGVTIAGQRRRISGLFWAAFRTAREALFSPKILREPYSQPD